MPSDTPERKHPSSVVQLPRKARVLAMPQDDNSPSPQPPQNTPRSAGHPAAYILECRSDLLLRHARQTRDIIKVSRRMGVRANDVFRVVLERLERLERRAA